MNAITSVVKLHLNRRVVALLVPLFIVAVVVVISILISLLAWRGGSQPASPAWINASRNNTGMLFSFAGFLVSMGVASAATTFPFALALGSTRRAFTLGTLAWNILQAAYLTVVFAVLTLLELATGHWFAGFYIFDITILGAGDLTKLIPIVFLSVLALLSIGGAFGASWVRFGARGPQVIAAVAAILIIVGLIIVIPSASVLIANFALWWLAVAGAVLVVIAMVGIWLPLRTATVR